jgi:ComF family protein
MFSATSHPVNRDALVGSTIARWLRRRARQWPPWWHRSTRLIPPRCLFCGQAADLGPVDLCSDCLQALPWAQDHAHFAGFNVPFEYESPVDEALRALKFHGDLCPARVFGALLAGAAATASRRRPAWPDPPDPAPPPDLPHLPDLFVPVPLHVDRLHERGFNQAERLAREAARWLGRPVAPRLLERRRATLPQTSLEAADRRRNVAGAFAPAPAAAAWLRRQRRPIRHVALVDDVLTTGATAEAAAAALRQAGLPTVSIWAVARPVSNSFTPRSRLA